ncbi:MAG: serine/threonine-protein kinase [Anaerolineae bacterium]
MITKLSSGIILQDRYQIIELLGAGGMGQVYRAMHLGLNQVVAIKENFGTMPEDKEQFRLEAQILANLRHNNLPRVIDHFFESNGRQYLVMEFIEGLDLGNLVGQKGSQSEGQVLDWMNQVFSAVQYLHNHKPYAIIHRDIKPANIKLQPDGQLFLVDFGIAKVLEPSKTTIASARSVSEGFSPPEQYTSGTDTRSDIYSLGATIYFLLTGLIPAKAMDRLLSHESLRHPREVNRGLSPNTEYAILRMLELDPNKRFQRIEEVMQALAPQNPASVTIRLLSEVFTSSANPHSSVLPRDLSGIDRPGFLRPPKKDLRITLRQPVSRVKNAAFMRERSAIVKAVLGFILNRDSYSEGTTIMLRSFPGTGTSEILKRVRKEMVRRGKNKHIAVLIDLGGASYTKAPNKLLSDLVRDMGMQLSARSGDAIRGEIRRIYDKYKPRYEEEKFKPIDRVVETKTRIAPLNFIEAFISQIRIRIGPGLEKETHITEKQVPNPTIGKAKLLEAIIDDLQSFD